MRSPDEGFDLEGPPKPKILRDPSPKKRNLVNVDFRDRWGAQKPFFRMAQEGPPGRSPIPEDGFRVDPRRQRPLISAENLEPNPFREVLGPTSATKRPKTAKN